MRVDEMLFEVHFAEERDGGVMKKYRVAFSSWATPIS